MVDVNSIICKIKSVGDARVRTTPMPGQKINVGNYQIEIQEDDQWVVVASGMPKVLAEQIVASATNRLICG